VFDGLLQALEAFHGSPEDDVSLLGSGSCSRLAYRRRCCFQPGCQATWVRLRIGIGLHLPRRCVIPRAQSPAVLLKLLDGGACVTRARRQLVYPFSERAFIATRLEHWAAATGGDLLSQTNYQGFTPLFIGAQGASGYVGRTAG